MHAKKIGIWKQIKPAFFKFRKPKRNRFIDHWAWKLEMTSFWDNENEILSLRKIENNQNHL